MEAPIRMTMMKVLNETVNILTSQRSRMLPLSSQHLLRGEKKSVLSIKVSPVVLIVWVRRVEEGTEVRKYLKL